MDTSRLQTYRAQDIRALDIVYPQSKRSRCSVDKYKVFLPGDGLGRYNSKVGAVSAACTKGDCGRCYKLDCPHDCHKNGM